MGASAEGAKQIRCRCCGTAILGHDDIEIGRTLEGSDGQVERGRLCRTAWKVVKNRADSHVHGAAIVEAGLGTVTPVGLELVNVVVSILVIGATRQLLRRFGETGVRPYSFG